MAEQTYRFSIEPQVKLEQATSQIGVLQKQLSKLQLPQKLGSDINKEIAQLSNSIEKYQAKISKGLTSKADSKGIVKLVKEIEQSVTSLEGKIGSLESETITLKTDTTALQQLERDIDALKTKIQTTFYNNISASDKTGLEKLYTAASRSAQAQGMIGRAQKALEKGDIVAYKKALDQLDQKVRDFADSTKIKMAEALTGNHYKTAAGAMRGFSTEIENLKTHAENADKSVEDLRNDLQVKEQSFLEKEAQVGQNAERVLNRVKEETNNLRKSTNDANNSVEGTVDAYEKLSKAASTIERQVESYFGLNAIFRTVANMAREAMQTVKELDKAMTETAVVTNFSVSDMWEKLPLYTAEANKLGSSIKDVYEATTLYYQQGLNTTQSMGLAVETLKMARIAGMEAKDATDAMTAALRGFNLELNQTSAQRINDVYSELAAITASDTQEISTAMEKVASLAHNAGMELETTSAFLAQMIETTREAPENLGTALKTVVARFQEMKQDPTKLIDSEGVMLDANKVDKALKSIGVNLMNTNGEFRKLDDVFLEIARKWDTMSMGQQRYIATMAAGSRQQSRFIAMMSNYSRTMELVDAAYDSAGASQRQFEKTLESMDSKLKKLKNAYDQFIMGLMNNKFLKGIVDFGTNALTILNKVIDTISSFTGPLKNTTKMILTLLATFGGLTTARGVLQKGISFGIGFIGGKGAQKKYLDSINFGAEASEEGGKSGRLFNIAFINELRKLKAQAQQELNNKQPLEVSIENRMPKNPIDLAYYKKLLKDADQFEINGQTDLAAAVKKEAEGMLSPLTKTQSAALKVANGFNSAGMAIQAFGTALANSNSKLAPFGKALSAVGSGVMHLGTVMMPALNAAILEGKTGMAAFGVAAKTALTSILPWVAVLAAVATVGYLVYNELTREKREMEALANAAKASSDVFDNLKTSSEELKNSIEEIRNSDNLFDGLVAGTTEWNLALIEANQQILDLIKKHPLLQDFITTDQNGRMRVSEAGFKAVQDAQAQFLSQAQSLEILTNSAYNTKLKQQDFDNLLKEEKVYKTKARTLKHGGQSYTITQDQADKINYNALSAEAQKEWDSIQAQIEAEAADSRKQAMRAALATNGELNDTVLNIFSQNLDEVSKQFEGETDITTIKQAYADFIGGIFDSTTGTITDISGEEVSVDNDTLKKMYPQLMAILQFQEQASTVNSAIASVSNSFEKLFGKETGKNFIDDLLNNNLEIEAESLDKFLNMSEDELVNALENVTEEQVHAIMQSNEKDTNDLIALLKENGSNLRQAQTNSYKEAAIWYAKTSKKWSSLTAKVGAAPLATEITKKLTAGSADAINRFMGQIQNAFDAFDTLTVGEKVFDAIIGQPEEIQSELSSIITSIDWNSALERGNFYKEFGEGTEAYNKLNQKGKNFIKTLQNTDKKLDLTGKQFQELVQSSDFLGILTDKWSDFADETGHLDATAVENMAKQCGTLNELLEQGELDATTLATALNYFNDTGSFDGITGAVLSAIEEFDSLDKLIAQVKKDIDTFTPGENYEQGIEAFRGYANSLKENYEGGKYSSADTLSYAQALTNIDWKDYVKKHGKSNKSAEKQLIDSLEPLFTENEQDTTLNILRRMEQGKTLTGGKAEKTDAFTIGRGDQGQLQLHIDEKTTREDFQKALTDAYGFSEEFARAFTLSLEGQDWGFIDDNITDGFNKAGRSEGISKFVQGLADRALLDSKKVKGETVVTGQINGQQVNDQNQLVISRSEMEALRDLGGYDDIKQVREDLAKELGLSVDNIRVFNEETQNTNNYLKKRFGTEGTNKDRANKFLDLTRDAETGVVDFNKATDELEKSGISASKALDMAIDMAQKAGEEQVKWGDKLVDVSDIINGDQFNEAVEKLEDDSHWTNVGNIIGKAVARVLNEHGIGKTSSNDSSDNSTSFKPKTAEEIHTEYKADLTLQKEQIEKDLTNITEQAENLKKKIDNIKQANPNADTSELEAGLSVLDAKAQNLSKDLSEVNNKLNNLENKTVNVNVNFNKRYDGDGPSIEPRYKGKNNYISSSGFYVGSMAAGSGRGRLGPKGKGGLTLTGEEGFEVAWLPRENRSMILGAHGPQMTTLPSDAVVWNHEQSKKIVKQKGIPIGSMDTGNFDNPTTITDPVPVVVTKDKTKNDKDTKKEDKKKDDKHTNWYKEEVRRFNLNQQINKILGKIEERTSFIDKQLDKIGTTYGDISKAVKEELKLLKEDTNKQKDLQKSYNKQLQQLAGTYGSYKIKTNSKHQEYRAYKDKNQRHLWVGLTNSSGDTKDERIKTGRFITGDAKTGYSISRKQIEKYLIAQGGYGKKGSNLLLQNTEAMFNALQSELSSAQSGYDNATKAIRENKQKAQELNQKLAETFYLWENELTKVYDLTNKIADIEAKRARYQNEFALQLAQINAGYGSTAKAIKELNTYRQKELQTIKNKINSQKKLIRAQQKEVSGNLDFTKRIREQKKIRDNEKNSEAKRTAARQRIAALKQARKYIKYDKNADGTYSISVDYEKLQKEKNKGNISEKTYNTVKEILDEAVESNASLNESYATLTEALTEPYELIKDYQENLASLEKDLMDALVSQAQKEIDKLSTLNTSLSNATKKILDQVKKSINARRRAEDNAKTENDIAKKQQRLAALRANTSGGNQVEIAQLEKEIADAQQSYGRTLEDQMLSDMQTQADEAAKQRQEQIDIAKQQLEWNKANGVLASQVNEIIANMKKDNGKTVAEILASVNEANQPYWTSLVNNNGIESQVLEALNAQAGIAQLDEYLRSVEYKKMQAWVGKQDKYGNVTGVRGKANAANKEIAQAQKARDEAKANRDQYKKGTTEWAEADKAFQEAKNNLTAIREVYEDDTHAEGILAALPAKELEKKRDIKKLQKGLNTLIADKQITGIDSLKVTGEYDSPTKKAVKLLKKKLKFEKPNGKWNARLSREIKKDSKLKYYEQGGLARSTGPAWLDGTPTKPELVLNAQDTKNFMALRDVLSGVMHDISHMDTTNTYNSPTEINVNVNVEKIANDYDVDQMIARVKKDIVKDAGYRNVTMVRRIR